MKPRYYALLAIIAAAAAGTVLFVTAQRVQTADANLRHIQAETAREKQAMHVLHAEWDYLNRPDRLEALARAHLNMVPPQAGEIVPPKKKAEVAKSEASKSETGKSETEKPETGKSEDVEGAQPPASGSFSPLTGDGGSSGSPPRTDRPAPHNFQSLLDNLNKNPPAAGASHSGDKP